MNETSLRLGIAKLYEYDVFNPDDNRNFGYYK